MHEDGTWTENPELEKDAPGPSGISYESKRTVNWNYGSGHAYPQYGPMNGRQLKIQFDAKEPFKTHGIKYDADINLSGLPVTDPDTLALRYSQPTGSDLRDDGYDECVDVDECTDIDECATDVRMRRKRRRKTIGRSNSQLNAGSSICSDDEPVAKLSTRGAYHIQKKRSLATKLRAMSHNIDVVNSENDSIAPPTVERPEIVRPRPGPSVRDPRTIVYGFWLRNLIFRVFKP